MDTAALPPLLARSSGLNQLAFRPDGARLATADTTMAVEVREGERLVWSRSLASSEPKLASVQRVRGLAFAPDGAALYALATNRLAALDADTGAVLWDYRPPLTLGFLVTATTALAVRADGLVAAAFDNGAIGAWSPEGRLQGLWKDVDVQRRLAFLRDGRLLGDDSFGLSVFDVDTRKRLHRTPLRERSYGLAVAPDGSVAVRTLHEAWQIASSGEVFARTPVEPGLPLLAYNPCEPRLALGAAHAVLLADFDGRIVGHHEVPATPVVSLAFAPDGRLVVGGGDGTLRTF